MVFICLHLFYYREQHLFFKKSIQWLVGVVCFALLIGGIAVLSGDAEDLLFILYFETFPEHWHGNYNPVALISRMPEFYVKWGMYTGGGLILLLPFLFGLKEEIAKTPESKNTKILFFGILLFLDNKNPKNDR